MPAAFTPSPSIGATDPPLPDGPAANAATSRELLNNRRHLRGATWGALVWSGRLVVGGTAAAPSITVGAIEAVTLRDSSGVWRPYYKDTETALGIAQVEGAPASLTADTWHYVYAHDAAGDGNPHFQVSTTAPGTSLAWKNAVGTALYRYLGCFCTDGSGNPVPLVAHRGRYVYLNSILPGRSDSQSNSAWHDLSLSAAVPPHARLATLTITIDSGASFRSIGDVSSSGHTTDKLTRPFVLDGSQRIEWNANGSARAITATVHAFEE